MVSAIWQQLQRGRSDRGGDHVAAVLTPGGRTAFTPACCGAAAHSWVCPQRSRRAGSRCTGQRHRQGECLHESSLTFGIHGWGLVHLLHTPRILVPGPRKWWGIVC